MKGTQTFPKSEKLKSLKKIKELFNKSSSFYLYPFRILIGPVTEGVTTPLAHQVLVSVPKKNFRKAVERNRIKRLLRETYRCHKNHLPANVLTAHAIGIIYVGKEIHEFSFFCKRFKKLMEQIGQQNLS